MVKHLWLSPYRRDDLPIWRRKRRGIISRIIMNLLFQGKSGIKQNKSIVGKVIVGGYDENSKSSPYKLTFILKCNRDLKVDDAEADYKADQKGKKVS